MQIDFWVEASLEAGMGHLVRGANVHKKVKQMGYSSAFAGSLDKDASAFARHYGVAVEECLEPSSDMVVIDCLRLANPIEDMLKGYRIRASFTPLPAHPELPTHYFLRSHPEKRRRNATYVIDPNFALAGIRTASIEEIQFRNIHVGVCLSAGQELEEWELVSKLLSSADVGNISVISRSDRRKDQLSDHRLRYSAPTRNPWAFLAAINVFVGGDGVMIGEAVARGLPVFSITDALGTVKNATLVEAGIVCPVRRDLGEIQALAKLVTRLEILKELRSSSLAFAESAWKRGLAEAVIEVREGTYGVPE